MKAKDDAPCGETPGIERVVLFVPASTVRGGGEMARCRMLADELSERRDDLRIVFTAHRDIPLPNFEYGLIRIPDTPTRATSELRAAIDDLSPSLVIFDNGGRSSLAAYAHRAGARTVFISVRERSFRRATRWRWARWLDEHWAIRFDGITRNRPSPLGRCYLQRAAHHRLVDIQVLFAPPRPEAGRALLDSLQVIGRPVVLCAGGGGTEVAGRNITAIFADIAARLVAALPPSTPVLLVAGPLFDAALPKVAGAHVVSSFHPQEMLDVMANASLAVTGGGSLAPIAAALGLPVCALPSDKAEQRERVAGLAASDAVVAIPPDPDEAVRRILTKLGQENIEATPAVSNGIEEVVERIQALLQ